MKYYQLALILVLLLLLLVGKFFISPQKIAYEASRKIYNTAEFPRVKIYSTYPFNNRGEVVVNAGGNQGVKESAAAVVDGKILFGQVTQVFKNYSLVRTFFDESWQVPVRVGPEETDALLAGGINPRLTMVEKGKSLREGDQIYSASRDFPYGLIIGRVGKIIDAPASVFKEAELEFPYNLNDLRELEILD